MVRRADKGDALIVTALAKQLWPDCGEEIYSEMSKYLGSNDSSAFLAYKGDCAVGLALCCIRKDYVEGTSTDSVGYLEGIFVDPVCRNKGYAKALVHACEQWAESKGCLEFASDCESDNKDSIAFHKATGFREVNTIVCFVKKLR